MLWKKRNSNVARDDRESVQKVNIEDLSEDEKREFYVTASESSQLELHTGHVEHGYAIDQLSSSASCPRCQAPTQREYANFIYATQIAPRVMFAPAGYFCTICPAVVIDEALLREGISHEWHFLRLPAQLPSAFSAWGEVSSAGDEAWVGV